MLGWGHATHSAEKWGCLWAPLRPGQGRQEGGSEADLRDHHRQPGRHKLRDSALDLWQRHESLVCVSNRHLVAPLGAAAQPAGRRQQLMVPLVQRVEGPGEVDAAAARRVDHDAASGELHSLHASVELLAEHAGRVDARRVHLQGPGAGAGAACGRGRGSAQRGQRPVPPADFFSLMCGRRACGQAAMPATHPRCSACTRAARAPDPSQHKIPTHLGADTAHLQLIQLAFIAFHP